MTEFKNKTKRLCALILFLCVLIGTVLSNVPQLIYANESFNGIGSIVSSHGTEDPYTILEIVPDLKLGKLGYLVENGKAYYNSRTGKLDTFEGALSACDNATKRTDYINALKTQLSGIYRDSSKPTALVPLTYTQYEESYVEADGYNKLLLHNDESEVFSAQSNSPLTMVADSEGDYSIETTYTVNASGTGSHNANVDYYSVSVDQMDLANYFNVCFGYTSDHSQGGYQPRNDGYALTTQEAFINSQKEYLYHLDSNHILVGEKKLDIVYDPSTVYMEMSFEYKSASELDEGSIVYWPTESVFCPSQDGEYSARLVEGEPYVSAPGSGNFDQANDAYRYVGSGNGAFSISYTVGELDHDLVIGCIYYEGGFTSNNYLYKYVFNQSGLLDQEVNSDFAIDVITVTPSQFDSYNLDDVDMIYISGSSALYSGPTDSYNNATNDLTADQANSIYEAVIGNRFLPVILDYSVWDGNEPNTNIGKLAKLLCADELKEENKTFSGNTLAISGEWSAFSDGNSDNHFVNYNVYVVPENTGYNLLKQFVDPPLVNQSDSTKTAEFAQEAETAGFGTVASMINMENLYRETENAALGSNVYGYFDLMINPAINIEYIASYSAKREQYANNTIRVLDIEPCSIGATSKRQIEDKIKGYFGTTEYIFEFTHMTSAQFISKVEDLCNYDMIYMGLYTDTMNTNSGTKRTVYNDSNMNGLVYTNIGDRQYDGFAAGAMDNDYYRAATNRETNNWLQSSGDGNHDVRYSGNDLTEEKQKALITFAKSGCPVILADNFFFTDPAGNTHVYDFQYDVSGVALTANGNGYIDNCSRMYETIDTIKDYNNVMTEASLTTPSTASSQKEILYSFINLGKPRLKMTTATPVANQYYVATNGRNISMDLQLSNFGSADANATFDCVVYIDYNSDGRFSDTMERLGPNDYGIFLNGVQQEVKSRRNGEGEVEYYYELSPNKSGEQYTLTFNVSSDYYGIIPVKVKVTQSSNPYRYDSKQAYFYRSNTTGIKEPIKVLQILSTSGDYSVNAVGNQQKPFDMDITAINDDPYQGNDVDPYKYFSSGSYPVNNNNLTNRNNYNVVKSRLTQFSGSPFNTLLHSSEDMKDFEIDVDSITGDHFCQYVVNGYPNANQTAADPNNKLNLDDYDMLILGFGDCWTFFPEDKTLQQQAYAKIHEFIKAGKSVLFTHDTTSFGSNYYSKIGRYFTGDWAASDWAYYLNPLMCPDVGLDRYGIYSSNILQAGIDGITKDSSAMVTISDYYSLMKAADSGEIPSDKIVNGRISQGDLYDLVIEQAKKTQSDIAYEPNSNKQVLTREVQGRSSFNSNNHRTYTYASSKTMDINGNPGTDQIATGNHETSYAELLNVGQVLIYPYNLMSGMTNKIGNKTVEGGQFLKISGTHSQYYQIDMNNDDDEDGESDITVWLTLTGEDSYYGARNDARNNYYIYTMGNVTYSGVGHRNINYDGNEAEIKLYINTMITAYRAGIHAPDITIKQDSGMNSATLNTLYVGMDTLLNDDGRIGTETAIDGSDGSYEKVYFAVNDTNMVRGGSKTIELSYYLAYNSYEMIPENLRSSAKNLGTAENPDWVVPYDFRTYLKDGVTLNNSASDEKFVVSGATYCIHVPYSLVEATNDYSAIVRVGATTRLYPKGSTTASAEYTGYKDFHIQRVSLFDLD